MRALRLNTWHWVAQDCRKGPDGMAYTWDIDTHERKLLKGGFDLEYTKWHSHIIAMLTVQWAVHLRGLKQFDLSACLRLPLRADREAFFFNSNPIQVGC
jgi:hypothetical protein